MAQRDSGVLNAVEQQGNDISPQPAVTFVSYHHESEYDQAVGLVREYDPSQPDFGEIVGLVERARAHVPVVWPPERS